MLAIVGEATAMVQRIEVAGKNFRCDGSTWFARALTYGPFPPDGGLRCGDDLQRDLDSMVGIGANTLRIYQAPDDEFVTACRQRGLRILITLPWAQHVDFFLNSEPLDEAARDLVEMVERLRGEPAILAFLVGNEIPATLVRWMEPQRVRRALEHLIEVGRAVDAGALFSYASYPSTEYLMPVNADFAAYNIFLDDAGALRRYLSRLHNVAGDKPLMITEFGIDSKAQGESVQAEAMAWQVDEACRAGLAGSTVFSYSDSWYRGASEVTGWDFGLLRRDGSPKPAAQRVAEAWRDIDVPADGLQLVAPPRMSVIVCTCRGAAVLTDCLRSLVALRYADFEILVVNDGDDAEVAEVVAGFAEVRHLPMEHAGLSAARNRGAASASGEILVYTDDDCRADPDWLSYLALRLESGEFAAVGGPNVPPPAESFAEACVTAAPGGPAHVLLSDVVAEHVPGCNLAVRREAFEKIGGFCDTFQTAGDDVDFCWRLQAAGYRIGFHPAAWVWHLRRRTLRGYLRQQIGYGRAEAQLIPRHADRFGAVGAARWHGWVYDGAMARVSASSALIYQGVFGYAGYQSVYGGARGLDYVVSSVQWMLVVAALGLLAVAFPPAGGLAALMLVITLASALRCGWRANLPPGRDGIGERLVVSMLALVQPLVRGAVRCFGSLAYARLPRGLPPLSRPLLFPRLRCWPGRTRLSLWSSEGRTRDDFLVQLVERLESRGDSFSTGDGWQAWDVEILSSVMWSEQVTTVTEYHSADDRMTHLRLEARPTLLTVLWRTALVVAALFCWRTGISSASGWPVYVALAAGFVLPSVVRLTRLFRLRSVCLRIARELGFS